MNFFMMNFFTFLKEHERKKYLVICIHMFIESIYMYCKNCNCLFIYIFKYDFGDTY